VGVGRKDGALKRLQQQGARTAISTCPVNSRLYRLSRTASSAGSNSALAASPTALAGLKPVCGGQSASGDRECPRLRVLVRSAAQNQTPEEAPASPAGFALLLRRADSPKNLRSGRTTMRRAPRPPRALQTTPVQRSFRVGVFTPGEPDVDARYQTTVRASPRGGSRAPLPAAWSRLELVGGLPGRQSSARDGHRVVP